MVVEKGSPAYEERMDYLIDMIHRNSRITTAIKWVEWCCARYKISRQNAAEFVDDAYRRINADKKFNTDKDLNK